MVSIRQIIINALIAVLCLSPMDSVFASANSNIKCPKAMGQGTI